ncbi:hypothetical protein A1355_03210 [Methylomonas koyamae]|uniref:Uncharacterized protein n=1 Tax=Methylomonas koyamae TaxID=702114 RepID=A0A177NSE5_9GAMM|nr:hypothetical protein A1355_03210 [Methylomonas koyamae]
MVVFVIIMKAYYILINSFLRLIVITKNYGELVFQFFTIQMHFILCLKNYFLRLLIFSQWKMVLSDVFHQLFTPILD